MRIGLLKCDRVSEELQAIQGDYDEMFKACFQKAEPDFTFKIYDVINNELPRNMDENEAYLCTGSSASAYDDETWIKNLEKFITECHEKSKKLIGICFGHQLIANTLGGKTTLSKKGWGLGVRPVRFIQRKNWMTPSIDEFRICYHHQDQVEILPKDAELLGGNPHCNNAIYQIKEHILGIQGHPEFSTKYAEALMDSRSDIIPLNVINQARPTFSEKINNKEIHQMLINFLTQNSG